LGYQTQSLWMVKNLGEDGWFFGGGGGRVNLEGKYK
jgi:hypothetical protein